MNGPTQFARFAYPPNELGYCGPDDRAALLEYASSGIVDGGLRRLAHAFEGAWPYLELVAGCNDVADPLDARVVEAYWLGNDLADNVDPLVLWRSVEDRFRRRAGRAWSTLTEAMSDTARPTHAFHVFAVYPHVGLLRAGVGEPALAVLDRCRIRWGRVLATDATTVTVRSRPLEYDGRHLRLGTGRVEIARWGSHGLDLVESPPVGAWVALHWDWVCATLRPQQLFQLRRHTTLELDRVNAGASAMVST